MNQIEVIQHHVRTNVRKVIKHDRGATAVEYALMLVAIMLLVVVAYKALGNKVSSAVTNATGKLQ